MQVIKYSTVLLLLFVILTSSCNVSTYVLSTPNIPTVEKQGDFEASYNPALFQDNNPGYGGRNEFQFNYAATRNLLLQGNFLYGSSQSDETNAFWNANGFNRMDYNLGLGYYKNFSPHQISLISGFGLGRFNLARSVIVSQSEELSASFGQYSRAYGQFNYSFFSKSNFILNFGLRLERNFYDKLLLLDQRENVNSGAITSSFFQEWNNEELDVINSCFMIIAKVQPNEVHPYIAIGWSNMQNWTETHVNRSYVLFGIRFKHNFFVSKKDKI